MKSIAKITGFLIFILIYILEMIGNKWKIKNNIKTQIFDELFVYNNIFNNFLSVEDLKRFFHIDKKNNIVNIKNIDELLKFIYQFEDNLKNKISWQSKFQRKTRSYGVLSIFIFILAFLNKYLKFLLNKDNGEYKNDKKIKVSSYDFNKIKKKFFKKVLMDYIKQKSKIITIFDLWDIILFYQLNNWFLNQYIFNSLLDRWFNIYHQLWLTPDLYWIKHSFTFSNDKSFFWISLFNENDNDINSFERKNSYNIIFLDYKDFNKRDLGQLIREITYYLEKNKEKIFYNNIRLWINWLNKQDLKEIQKNITEIKKNKKFNLVINILPRKVLRLIYSSILIDPYIKEIEEILKKQNVNLVKDINKQVEEFYKEIIYKTLDEFNNFNKKSFN